MLNILFLGKFRIWAAVAIFLSLRSARATDGFGRCPCPRRSTLKAFCWVIQTEYLMSCFVSHKFTNSRFLCKSGPVGFFISLNKTLKMIFDFPELWLCIDLSWVESFIYCACRSFSVCVTPNQTCFVLCESSCRLPIERQQS